MKYGLIVILVHGLFSLAAAAADLEENPNSPSSPSEIEVVVWGTRVRPSPNKTNIDQEQIATMPEGDQANLSKIVAETTPGAMAGPTGQLFFRGTYEASVQYQLDGIQLPDFATARFGQIFPTQAIARVETLSGAFPAEYGERLGGVVNIVTKSGGVEPGGSAEITYGSYDTFSPSASYGGSLLDGKLRYFAAAIYSTTSRGLDTPQPKNATDINRGGEQAVHDDSQNNNELLKLDWIADNSDKFTLLFLNSRRFMQLPNFPNSFSPTDSIFTTGDSYGNPPYRYAPADTNDTQIETDNYIQTSWHHTFSDRSFVQVTPYWKGSSVVVGNDLANDLGGVQTTGAVQPYASFTQNQTTTSFGLHVDYSLRADSENRIKAGIFGLTAHTTGTFTVVTATTTPNNTQTYSDSSPVTQNQQALYIQDDYTPLKGLTINGGVRADFTQQALGTGEGPHDSSLQPRLGASYQMTDSTLIHAYYGRLYHNAPAQDLRVAFNGGNASGLAPYDVMSENADYYEAGIVQNWLGAQVASLTAYYRSAKNWLDDTQVPNTYITQPLNFAEGYAKGFDLSLHGPITPQWHYFANYSYVQARVKGLSGGIFTQEPASTGYQNLDTDQAHTIQSGVTWRGSTGWWWSVVDLYGSGFPTSPDSSLFLPPHLTFDTSLGRQFKWQDWKFAVSADLLNVFDDAYPITISNGLVGSQYAAGREFFLHLGTMF